MSFTRREFISHIALAAAGLAFLDSKPKTERTLFDLYGLHDSPLYKPLTTIPDYSSEYKE